MTPRCNKGPLRIGITLLLLVFIVFLGLYYPRYPNPRLAAQTREIADMVAVLEGLPLPFDLNHTTIYVDVDNTLADGWARFMRNTQPSWPGHTMGQSAFRLSEYSTDPAMKGGAQALAVLRSFGAKVVILTARNVYENHDVGTKNWLQEHGIPFDHFILVADPKEKIQHMRRAKCTPTTCIFVDDLVTKHQYAQPFFMTDVLCNVRNETRGLQAGWTQRHVAMDRMEGDFGVTIELFDPHFNNWQNIVRHYLPPEAHQRLLGALVPSIHVTAVHSTLYKIMVKRATGYGLNHALLPWAWDSAWLTKQTPMHIHASAQEVGLEAGASKPSTDARLPGWGLPTGRHQRANAIPGITQLINEKAAFCSALQSRGLATGEAPFPRCFLLPSQYADLVSSIKANPSIIWVYKPSETSNGVGVQLLRGDKVAEVAGRKASAVVQEYIADPILYQGLKTDLRFYLMVPGLDPPRVYMNEEGYARVAGAPYTLDTFDHIVHVTNSVHNHQNTRLRYGTQYADLLRSYGLDPQTVWTRAADMAWKAVLAVGNELGCLAKEPAYRYPCGSLFQQFGMDFIVDTKGQVWLLELNPDPSLKFRNEEILQDDLARDRDIFRMTGLLKPHLATWTNVANAVERTICRCVSHVCRARGSDVKVRGSLQVT